MDDRITRECEACKALVYPEELELVRMTGVWTWVCKACREEQEWPRVRGDVIGSRLVRPVRNRLSRPR